MDGGGFGEWGTSRRGWSEATADKYVYWAARADSWLRGRHDTGLLRANTDRLLDFYDGLPRSPSTRNQARGALIAWFDWQSERGARTSNPARALPRLRRPPSVPKALDTDIAGKVLVAAAARGLRWEAYVSLLFHAGLRREEARTLRWSQWTGAWLRVTGKGSKDRDVPVNARLGDVLARWQGECGDRWVFPSPRRSGPMSKSWIALTLRQIGDEVGLVGLHPHVGRHTFATSVLCNGADLREVQELLGHASVQTTQVYTKVRPSGLREAVDRLEF